MSQNRSTVIYLLVTYFSLNCHQSGATAPGVSYKIRLMTEAGGNCPRSCSNLPVWGHCTPLLKELSHEQRAGDSSSRAPVSPHSIHQRLEGESAIGSQGEGLFVLCTVPPSIPSSLAGPQEPFGCLCLSSSVQGWVCGAPSKISFGHPV